MYSHNTRHKNALHNLIFLLVISGAQYSVINIVKDTVKPNVYQKLYSKQHRNASMIATAKVKTLLQQFVTDFTMCL